MRGRPTRYAFTLLGVTALILGIISTGWLVLMVRQWAMPWSSLSVLAPPGAPLYAPKPPAK